MNTPSLPPTTQEYIDCGAPEGERNAKLFAAACQLRDKNLDRSTVEALLRQRGQLDGLGEPEITTTINSAFSKGAREPARKVGTGPTPTRRAYGRPTASAPPIGPSNAPQKKYALDTEEMPTVEVADPTRTLLRLAFKDGEGIRITKGQIGKDGKDHPYEQGQTLTREEWLRQLDIADGEFNKIMPSAERAGVFIAINPLRPGGSKDEDVTDYRHTLVEFDGMPLREQWNLIRNSKLPCTAIVYSGGRSVHAWVKIDATNRSEYDERVALVYKHFEPYGLDAKNKNPGRLCRLPGVYRLESRQKLLAVNVGAESFTAWAAGLELVGNETYGVKELLARKFDESDQTVIGERWLCKGGSLLLIGSSGIGKSSLVMQMMVTWALGKPFFGVKPVRPLKSLIIQAENDQDDMAEMLQGVVKAMNLTPEEIDLVDKNAVFVRESVRTGPDFVRVLQRLIDRHHPDLVWIDPLLSYIGDDISQQAVCSTFLRNWVNPVLHASGAIAVMVHHTGKPRKDKGGMKDWTDDEYAYLGIGSSELTNWARAVIVLRKVEDDDDGGTYELKFSKRGKRAVARSLSYDGGDPQRTTSVYLRQGNEFEGIQWVQVLPMAKRFRGAGQIAKDAENRKSRPSGAPRKQDKINNGMLLDALSKRIDNWPVSMSVLAEAARIVFNESGEEISFSTARNKIREMVSEDLLADWPGAGNSTMVIPQKLFDEMAKLTPHEGDSEFPDVARN